MRCLCGWLDLTRASLPTELQPHDVLRDGLRGNPLLLPGFSQDIRLSSRSMLSNQKLAHFILPSVSVLEHLFLKLAQMMPLSASQVQRYEHQASELHCFLRSTFVRQGTGSREKGLPAELSPLHLRRHPSQRAA